MHFYDLQQLLRVHGFDEKGWELGFWEPMHFMLDLVEGHAGQEDDGEAGAMLLEVGEDAEAVEFGHVEVEEHEVDGQVLETLEGCFAVAGFVDGVPGVSKEVDEREPLDRRVIAHQQPR